MGAKQVTASQKQLLHFCNVDHNIDEACFYIIASYLPATQVMKMRAVCNAWFVNLQRDQCWNYLIQAHGKTIANPNYSAQYSYFENTFVFGVHVKKYHFFTATP